jgi:hypothetical protein
MINFTKMNGVAVVADNKVSIGGLEYMLTDDECIKLNDIIKGMISTRNTTNSLAPAKSNTTTTTTTTKSSKDSKDFPDLGTPTCTIGFVTAYAKLIRYWETGFCPNKVKYGIKQSLKEAGAKWNSEQGAFEFPTVKAANDWLKAQKARQSK